MAFKKIIIININVDINASIFIMLVFFFLVNKHKIIPIKYNFSWNCILYSKLYINSVISNTCIFNRNNEFLPKKDNCK